MNLEERINALVHLGEYLSRPRDDRFQQIVRQSESANPWFSPENIERAVNSIAAFYLQRDLLDAWVSNYPDLRLSRPRKKVGLVMAGNIPLVGFQDLLCVFVAGHISLVKLSDKDKYLLPFLLKIMIEFDHRVGEYIEYADGPLKNFDAIMATGSNNSARYFESYFGRYPHIIRKNRNAVAVLTGAETAEALHKLGKDVYTYFGLGCRNVSKLYLPEGYDFRPLLEALYEYRSLMTHDRFKNNFDYQFALLILNKEPHRANECILLTENKGIASPIAGLYYEYYKDINTLIPELLSRQEEIQCVVGEEKEVYGLAPVLKIVPFGDAQRPQLTDYADGVDVMDFLMAL